MATLAVAMPEGSRVRACTHHLAESNAGACKHAPYALPAFSSLTFSKSALALILSPFFSWARARL